MGVPKFFRWLSERYPSLSRSVDGDEVPEFDNLYLDMNGIIHPCSHPSDDPTFVITEQQIFDNIFRYIEFLIQTIKPQNTFFMAVDGCAPRAKMNQQRARRFKTAQSALEAEEEARKKGEIIKRDVPKFDSNTITPGTDFMARLDKALQFYIKKRISERDPTWIKPQIIYSGHQTPGEGEHKIADYIRYLRTDPGYKGGLRHCLYGLDADLMHLSLASHEKNFCLLREQVKFARPKKHEEKKRSPIVKPESIKFFLLSITLLRDYLQKHEYQDLFLNSDISWDMTRVVDDWIFLNFLVGNDFIPHVPHLHIKMQHIPDLVEYHIQVLKNFNGQKYVIENGIINLDVFHSYISIFASEFDIENHQNYEADASWLQGKRADRLIPTSKPKKIKQKPLPNNALQSMFGDSESDGSDIDDSDLPEELKNRLKEQGVTNKVTTSSEHQLVELDAFKKWRCRYYYEKWKGFGSPDFDQKSPEDVDYLNFNWENVTTICKDYLRTLQWISHYYFNGVKSWGWFYPHHYAPFLTDLVKVVNENSKSLLEFAPDKPFLPFEQLLGVLPPLSRHCLPKCYHDFMTSESSPIADFYPEKFGADLNGKDADWEAIVLIPFIDEKRLIKTMEAVNDQLNDEEKSRNCHVGAHIFTYTTEKQPGEIFGSFKIEANFAESVQLRDINQHRIPDEMIKRHMLPINSTSYVPGFPTLDYLSHKATYEKAKITIFEQASSNASCILNVREPSLDLETLVQKFFGLRSDKQSIRTCYYNWPHIQKGQVVEIFDREKLFSCHQGTNGRLENRETDYNYEEILRRITDKDSDMFKRQGINAGKFKILAKIKKRSGRRVKFMKSKFHYQDIFTEDYVFYPAAMLLTEYNNNEFSVMETSTQPLPYAIDSTVFISNANDKNLGALATVKSFLTNKANEPSGKIEIEMTRPWYPNISEIVKKLTSNYRNTKLFSTKELAMMFQCNFNSLFKIMSNVMFEYDGKSKIMLGFNATNRFKGLYDRRYAVPVLVNGRSEHKFTQKFVDHVALFNDKFSEVVGAIMSTSDKVIKEKDVRNWSRQRTLELKEWIEKEAPWRKNREEVENFVRTLPSEDIFAIQATVDKIHNETSNLESKFKVVTNFREVFQWQSGMDNIQPVFGQKFELYDRVRIVRPLMKQGVPIGSVGTVVAQRFTNLQSVTECTPETECTQVDILLDLPGINQMGGNLNGRCSENRGITVNVSYLIKLPKNSNKASTISLQPVSSTNVWKKDNPDDKKVVLLKRDQKDPKRDDNSSPHPSGYSSPSQFLSDVIRQPRNPSDDLDNDNFKTRKEFADAQKKRQEEAEKQPPKSRGAQLIENFRQKAPRKANGKPKKSWVKEMAEKDKTGHNNTQLTALLKQQLNIGIPNNLPRPPVPQVRPQFRSAHPYHFQPNPMQLFNQSTPYQVPYQEQNLNQRGPNPQWFNNFTQETQNNSTQSAPKRDFKNAKFGPNFKNKPKGGNKKKNKPRKEQTLQQE